MLERKKNKLTSIYYFLGSFLFAAFAMVGHAYASPIVAPLSSLGECSGIESMGQVLCNVIEASGVLSSFIVSIAYMVAIVLGFAGIWKLKEHVETPDRVSIWEPSKRFLAGGALFSLPFVANVVQTVIVGDHADPISPWGGTPFAGATSGGGLDTVLVALVQDLFQPAIFLFGYFAYLAGFVLVFVGIMRLLKSAQEGPKGPGGFGTIMTFFTAGVLFSLDTTLGAFSTSLFLSPETAYYGTLSYGTGDPVVDDHVLAVISAILGFATIVGWVSFIRGWFILRDVSEGAQQASLMAAITHIFGGALAVNLGPLLNAVQYTFGLDAVGVMFS